MRRALGYIPDEPDVRDWGESRLGLSVLEAPAPRVSLRPGAPPVYDQGRTSTCVAQAMAGAIEILERRAATHGLPANVPSRLFMYFNSRRMHSGGPAIFDTGTYLRTCAKALNRLGVPDEGLWPFSTSPFKVNRTPTFQAYMRGNGRRGGEYYRIRSEGSERVKAVKAALEAGYPVAFGTRIEDSFMQAEGANIIARPARTAPIAGAHAMLLIGYETLATGTVFEVRNSWGKGWREEGHCYITEDYLRWPHTRDLQVIKGWDLIRGSK